ncbi:hypothetical protein EDD16DRAFT_1898485 [Pisolithus croceorrhizus]|nr:hypothetical protein EDD16DRAFT_1898485 [Pisolithus croceorrhizus]
MFPTLYLLFFPASPSSYSSSPNAFIPPFTVEPVNGGDNTYAIRVENRNTRGQENRVFAFEDQPAEEWVIVYREFQNAYTEVTGSRHPRVLDTDTMMVSIQRRDDPAGWTVPPLEETELRQVTLSPLISTPSLPLQFLPRQLFRFERVPEE